MTAGNYEEEIVEEDVTDGDGHNSDLRDSHEYIKKQMWGAQICKRLLVA